MKISEIIELIKCNCKGEHRGKKVDDESCRDQILYGGADKDCTGIVVTCFANIDVLRKAEERKANLVICHESLFWNHSDEREWLKDNEVFKEKTAILDRADITVWRFHDYIHSGIKLQDGTYADGIFYGIMKELGWEEYLIASVEKPLLYELPKQQAKHLARQIMQKCGFKGAKVVGDPECRVSKVFFCEHLQGKERDNEKITKIENECFDLMIPLEMSDNTVAEYVRDASLLGQNKIILSFGHFNTEEPGMRYYHRYLKDLLNEEVPVSFAASADMFDYLLLS